MRALHRATLALYTDLTLEGVLHRITQSAKDLANARYAAIGIPDGKGGLETFVTIGMREEEVRRIPHHPVGKGLIGEILRSGQSLRVREISRHPAAAGFPSGHPIMHSFLGVPIAAYGRPIGQIYLTDRIDAPEFTEEDQQLIELLAAHAAAAIENARLYRQVLRSQGELSQKNEELALMNNLGSAVASSMDLDELLQTLLENVMGLFEARAGEIYLREENEGAFRLAIHRGEPGDSFWPKDRFHIDEGVVGRVGKSGESIWTSELKGDPHLVRASMMSAGVGTLVATPLTARGRVVGVLTLAFDGERPRNSNQLGLLAAVGAGIGISVENARLYRQARRLAVLEERERIGMDLHDGIIQSIYAVGLTLEYTRLMAKEDPEGVFARIEEAIGGLNAIIRDIRAYILDLQPARFQMATLREGLEMLLREFKANTLVEADLRIEPEALEGLGKETAAAVFHIVQEALANAGKHAKASHIWVSISADDGRVALHVIDNGRGFDLQREHTQLGHGLQNMDERARQVGGDFEIASSPGEGTTITVRLPAEQEHAARPAARSSRAQRGSGPLGSAPQGPGA
jgi:signal transduction histidine kinase